MKKILFAVLAASILVLCSMPVHAGSGSQVWNQAIGAVSTVAVHPLGTFREEESYDSTGTKTYRYVRVWSSAHTGEALYDTTVGFTSQWNVTPISPGIDSSGVNDSTNTFTKFVPKCSVAGVMRGHTPNATATTIYYAWMQTSGYTDSLRMQAPGRKALSAVRAWTAGMAVCPQPVAGSRLLLGVGASSTSSAAIGANADTYMRAVRSLAFGRICATATQDSSTVRAIINTR